VARNQYWRTIVGEHAGHRREVTDVAVHDAKKGAMIAACFVVIE
jgi:hypothetical protein